MSSMLARRRKVYQRLITPFYLRTNPPHQSSISNLYAANTRFHSLRIPNAIIPIHFFHTSSLLYRKTVGVAILDDDDDDGDELPFAQEVIVDSDEEDEGDSKDEILPKRMFDLDVSPLKQLNEYYRNEHGVFSGVPKKKMIDGSENWGGVLMWTVEFTCPVDNVVYRSGTIRNFEGKVIKDLETGRVFYPCKAAARNAAAWRALEVIQYQDRGIVEPRVCEEDPSQRIEELAEEPVSEPNTLSSPSPTREQVPMEELAEEPVSEPTTLSSPSPTREQVPMELTVDMVKGRRIVEVAAGLAHAIPPPAKEVTPVQQVDTVDDIKDEDYEEEEYVIRNVPGSGTAPPSHRALEALAQAPTKAAAYDESKTRVTIDPVQQLEATIKMANTWADANKSQKKTRNPHRIILPRQDTPNLLLVGKSILSGLAKANQNVTISQASSGAEDAASKVLEVLCKTQNARPDADAYTLFLRCLQGGSPKVIAEKAEKILNDMREEIFWRGHLLPKPNTGTMNALIQLWAQIGSTSGRYDNIGEDFVPNRESFLAILSSSAYEPFVEGDSEGFDSEFAGECIKRMRELADDNESLLPDTQIYNAPLRWSGGSQFHISRPYARYIAWDDHEKLFRDGVQEFDEKSAHVQNARAVEAWVEEMKTSGDERIQPNIESYEAVIQAWVRTATLEGLDRSESVAEMLLSDLSNCSTRPRLQTFHPILAGWMYSQHAKGLGKLQEWIERLESYSESVPGLLPDGRILESLIAAHVSRQQTLKDGTNSEAQESLLDSASACSRILQQFCEPFELSQSEVTDRDPFSYQYAPFSQTIQAWSNVAFVNLNPDDADSFDRALIEMLRTVALFEKNVQLLVGRESSASSGLLEYREPSDQVRYLISNAHHVYHAFTSCFIRLCDAKRKQGDRKTKSSDDELLSRYLAQIERISRRVGELHEIDFHLKALQEEKRKTYSSDRTSSSSSSSLLEKRQTLTYEDRYSYGPTCKSKSSLSRSTYPWQIVKLLEDCPSSPGIAGDVVRLCLLAKDLGKAFNTSSKLQDSVDAILDRVISEGGKSMKQITLEAAAAASDSSHVKQPSKRKALKGHHKRSGKQRRSTKSKGGRRRANASA